MQPLKNSNVLKKKKLLIGCSGGPDSMALCLLAKEWAEQHDYQLYTVTVDHKIREESTEEAHRVSQWLVNRNIATHISQITWGEETKSYEISRKLRYNLLFEYATQNEISCILTGHQKNDNVENFLLRMSHLSGTSGLASMETLSSLIHNQKMFYLYRPLLQVQKDRLVATCEYNKQEYVYDYLNFKIDTLKSQRARIRQGLLLASEKGIDFIPDVEVLIETFTLARQFIESLNEAFFANYVELNKNFGYYVIKFNAFIVLPITLARHFTTYMINKFRGITKAKLRANDLQFLVNKIRERAHVSELGLCRFVLVENNKLFVLKIHPYGKQIIKTTGTYIIGGWAVTVKLANSINNKEEIELKEPLLLRGYSKQDHYHLSAHVDIRYRKAVDMIILLENIVAITDLKNNVISVPSLNLTMKKTNLVFNVTFLE